MESFVINVRSPVGVWGVTGDELGLSRLSMPNEHPRASRGHAPRALVDIARQLEEYFAGDRRTFEVKFAEHRSTPFQRDVWSALQSIPYGEVRTYAKVAASIGRVRATRAVGNANHANPWPIIVPCHRVVAANGLGGYGGGEEVKRFLLDLEDVHYD